MNETIGRVRRHLVPLAIFLFLDVLLIRNYFSPSAIPTGTDVFPWLTRIKVDSSNFGALYTWDSTTGGSPRLIGNIDIFLMAANFGFNNPVLTLKLFIFATTLLAEFSAYYCAFYLTLSRLASSLAGYLFVLSPFFLSMLSLGQLAFLLPFALLPIVLPLYTETMRIGNLSRMLLLSLFCTFIIFVGRWDVAKFLGLFLASLIFADVLFGPKKAWRANVARLAKFSLILIGTLFVAFLPDITLFAAGATPAFVQGLKTYETLPTFLGDTPDLYRALLGLFQGGYYSTLWGITLNGNQYLSPQSFFIIMSALPITAFASLLSDKRRTTYTLAFVAMTSSFMAKGLNPPLGGVTYWLYNSVPFGYVVVRGALHWIGLTTLAYSILSALTVNALLKRLNRKTRTTLPHSVSWDISLAHSKKSVRYFSLIRMFMIPASLLVILTISQALGGSAYAVSPGLQVWNVPDNISAAYNWMSMRTGDFRVVSFPWQQSYMFVPASRSGSGWWQGDVGNTLGYALDGKKIWSQSYFFSDIGFDLQSYLTRLILDNATRDLPKMLGVYDVRYFVDNGYEATALGSPLTLREHSDPGYQSAFVSSQLGLTLAHTDGNTRVFENGFWAPRLFIPQGSILVIGGKDALSSLATIDGFDFRQWAVFFADQIEAANGIEGLTSVMSRADVLLFKDTGLTDLAFLLARDKGVWLTPSEFIPSDQNSASNSWTLNRLYSELGLLTLSPTLASANGNVSLTMPFKVPKLGSYEIWARLGFGSDRGTVRFQFNEKPSRYVTPVSSEPDVRWVNLGEVDLNTEQNVLHLQNTASLFGVSNDIDQIVLMNPQTLQDVSKALSDSIATNNQRLIFMYGIRSGSDWLTDLASAGNLTLPVTILASNLTETWRTTDPSHVAISSGPLLPLPTGIRSAAVSFLPGRTAYTMMDLTSEINLQYYDNLVIAFKGQGTNDLIGVNFLFGDSSANEATFNFVDASDSWRIISFPLSKPSFQQGSVDWSRTWKVQFSTGSRQTEGSFSLALFVNRQVFTTINTVSPIESRYSFAPPTNTVSYSLNIDGAQIQSGSTLTLEKGPHQVTLPYPELVSDGLAVYSVRRQESSPSLGTVFSVSNVSATVISYTMVDPTTYRVHISASAPFNLVFSDNFHPLWRAKLVNDEFGPSVAYGSMLSFYIPAKGQLELMLEFAPQDYARVTGLISILALVLLLGVVVYKSHRRKNPAPIAFHP